MKNLFFILSLSIPVFVMARLSSSEVEFKSNSLSYQITKSESKWTYKDSNGAKKIEIKDCNAKLIEKHWRELTQNLERLQTAESSQRPSSNPTWVQYNHKKMNAFSMQSYFQKIPQTAQSLILESKKICKSNPD